MLKTLVPMSQPDHPAIRPHEQLGPPIVGGLLIGLTGDNSPTVRQKRKSGQRGRDAKSRKKRSCTRCLKCNGTRASDCAGRIGNKGGQMTCQFFTKADADAAVQHGAEGGLGNVSELYHDYIIIMYKVLVF